MIRNCNDLSMFQLTLFSVFHLKDCDDGRPNGVVSPRVAFNSTLPV